MSFRLNPRINQAEVMIGTNHYLHANNDKRGFKYVIWMFEWNHKYKEIAPFIPPHEAEILIANNDEILNLQ